MIRHAPGMVAVGLNRNRLGHKALTLRCLHRSDAPKRKRPAAGFYRTAGPVMRLRKQVNGYDALRDYLKRQTLPEFVLNFDEIEEIIDAALPRAAQRASWWETLRSPQEKMPQREACLEAGFVATRLPDGKTVRFRKTPRDKRLSRQVDEP